MTNVTLTLLNLPQRSRRIQNKQANLLEPFTSFHVSPEPSISSRR